MPLHVPPIFKTKDELFRPNNNIKEPSLRLTSVINEQPSQNGNSRLITNSIFQRPAQQSCFKDLRRFECPAIRGRCVTVEAPQTLSAIDSIINPPKNATESEPPKILTAKEFFAKHQNQPIEPANIKKELIDFESVEYGDFEDSQQFLSSTPINLDVSDESVSELASSLDLLNNVIGFKNLSAEVSYESTPERVSSNRPMINGEQT